MSLTIPPTTLAQLAQLSLEETQPLPQISAMIVDTLPHDLTEAQLSDTICQLEAEKAEAHLSYQWMGQLSAALLKHKPQAILQLDRKASSERLSAESEEQAASSNKSAINWKKLILKLKYRQLLKSVESQFNAENQAFHKKQHYQDVCLQVFKDRVRPELTLQLNERLNEIYEKAPKFARRAYKSKDEKAQVLLRKATIGLLDFFKVISDIRFKGDWKEFIAEGASPGGIDSKLSSSDEKKAQS